MFSENSGQTFLFLMSAEVSYSASLEAACEFGLFRLSPSDFSPLTIYFLDVEDGLDEDSVDGDEFEDN